MAVYNAKAALPDGGPAPWGEPVRIGRPARTRSVK